MKNKMIIKKQLETLLKDRTKVLAEIIAEELVLSNRTQAITKQELQIKIDLEKDIASADQAELKTKYSNEAKRRLELEKRLNSDESLVLTKDRKLKTELLLLELNGKDKIYRTQERFLFKAIDVYLAELDIKEKEQDGK